MRFKAAVPSLPATGANASRAAHRPALLVYLYAFRRKLHEDGCLPRADGLYHP
jgi:hypothetical protein